MGKQAPTPPAFTSVIQESNVAGEERSALTFRLNAAQPNCSRSSRAHCDVWSAELLVNAPTIE